jgi:hypothetical protein
MQAKIAEHGRNYERTTLFMRYPDSKIRSPNKKFRSFLESHKIVHEILKVIAVLGVCLMITGQISRNESQSVILLLTVGLDGVLTPAQSILGAVEGKTPERILLSLVTNFEL